MSHKMEGVVVLVKEIEQITEKFKKREFVIETIGEMYPQTVMFQSVQDKCAMLDGIMEGETVDVSFNIRGKAWESPNDGTKYFNTLDCWKVEKIAPMAQPTPTRSEPATPAGSPSDSDDLPF